MYISGSFRVFKKVSARQGVSLYFCMQCVGKRRVSPACGIVRRSSGADACKRRVRSACGIVRRRCVQTPSKPCLRDRPEPMRANAGSALPAGSSGADVCKRRVSPARGINRSCLRHGINAFVIMIYTWCVFEFYVPERDFCNLY